MNPNNKNDINNRRYVDDKKINNVNNDVETLELEDAEVELRDVKIDNIKFNASPENAKIGLSGSDAQETLNGLPDEGHYSGSDAQETLNDLPDEDNQQPESGEVNQDNSNDGEKKQDDKQNEENKPDESSESEEQTENKMDDKDQKDDGKSDENGSEKEDNKENNTSRNDQENSQPNASDDSKKTETTSNDNKSEEKDEKHSNEPQKKSEGAKPQDKHSNANQGNQNRRQNLKDKWNNRPKNASEFRDRARNAGKNAGKNLKSGIKNRALSAANNTKAGRAVNKAKNAVNKVKNIKKIAVNIKAVVAAIGAGWPVLIAILIAVVIAIIVAILFPGKMGNANTELSNYSKTDQKTLEKMMNIFEDYPDADGALAMATVLYPYHDVLWNSSVNSMVSDSYSDDEETDEEPLISPEEEGDDKENVSQEKEDEEKDDVYLVLFRKYRYRKKLKELLKELNKGQDSYFEYLKNDYFNSDKGYKSMIDNANVDEETLKNAIVEDLKVKKDWFVNYVYQDLSCSVSFESAGTVEVDDILKSNVLIDVKEESCKTSKIENCNSMYTSPITLEKYIMSVAYEEIGVSANTDIEKLKAQMIAAKSFVLSRWDTMGWDISQTSDGSYVIPIRSNTNDQDFCDIDVGCPNKINGRARPAIDEATRALMVEAWNQTQNVYLYDNSSKMTGGSYCANRQGSCDFCQKGTCLSHDELNDYISGTLYTTILGEQYSSYSLITVENDYATVAVPGDVVCTSNTFGSGGVPDQLFTYYYQTDYPNVAFCGASSSQFTNSCASGSNSICSSGCGVTSYAMIVSTLSDEQLDPVAANNEAAARGACAVGSGSYNTLFTDIGNNHSGFTVEEVELSRNGADQILVALRNGALVAANVQAQSPFTNGGHWIVIRGIAGSGKVKVADPNSREITTSETYPIYDFVDKNWLIDGNGTKHSWYIIYGPKSPDYASKLSSTSDPGVATGYLGNPTDPNNTSRSFMQEGNSSSFPKYSWGQCHGGVDLDMNTGTPIYAMDGGVVEKVGDNNQNCFGKESCKGNVSYGIYVVINHGNGYKTLYAHLSQRLVNAGDQVGKGQQIGVSGSTGNSSGPHLHLELQNTSLLDANGRDAAKCEVGKGLMNPSAYINSQTTYVGQSS